MPSSFRKSIKLIRSGLLNPTVAWQEYFQENASWKRTVLQLSLPIVIFSALATALFHSIFHNSYVYKAIITPQILLFDIVSTLVSLFIMALVFSYVAGKFEGEQSFNRAIAAVTFASLPVFAGLILSFLPLVGWLLAFVLALLSLVFLYKIIPLYLLVPEDKRSIHFLVSLICTLIVVIIVNWSITTTYYYDQRRSVVLDSSLATDSPIHAGTTEAVLLKGDALDDIYIAPENSEVSDQQMQEFIQTMKLTHIFLEERVEVLQQMAEELENKEEKSISEIMKISRMIGQSALSRNDAEMRVVKRYNKNWREHQWVKEQLRIAATRQSGVPGVEHNSKMYQKYSDELSASGFNP